MNQGQSEGQTVRAMSPREEIGNLLDELTERSNELFGRMENNLNPVMIPEPPCDTSGEKGLIEELPPLYEDYRRKLYAIRSTMISCYKLMDRVQL